MKLAKKVSKSIALCAVLAIIGAMGGVLTSCSNGSEETTPIEDDDKDKEEGKDPAKTITFEVTEDSTNAENTTLMFKYDRSAVGAKELVAIDKCGIVVKLNGTKVKTIDKLEFALDDWGASFDEKDKEPVKDAKNMKEYKLKVSLGKKVAKGDKVVVYYNEGVGTITGEGKDAEAVKTLVVALVDTDKAVNYYKPLVEEKKNFQPLFPKNDGDGGDKEQATGGDKEQATGGDKEQATGGDKEQATGGDKEQAAGGDKEEEKDPPKTEEPKETVICKLDFSGAEPPEHNWMSDNFFVANEGVKMQGAWSEFAFVPKEMPNLEDATHVRVTLKCSDDAAFGNDNNRFMLGGYKYSDEEKKDTNISWTCFLNGSEDSFPKDFTAIEKQIKWEPKYDDKGNKIDMAEFDDIGGFKIWDCNFAKGTLTVQSIEFIKK